MPLLQLIMDNFFFVIIAIAILSSLLNKLRSRDGSKANPMMPSFGGRPEPERQQEVSVGTEPSRSLENMTGAHRSEDRTNAAKEARSFGRVSLAEDLTSNVSVTSLAGRREAAAANADSIERMKPTSSALKKPSENEAVQGMIWAEIFGPPRSKNPHKASRLGR